MNFKLFSLGFSIQSFIRSFVRSFFVSFIFSLFFIFASLSAQTAVEPNADANAVPPAGETDIAAEEDGVEFEGSADIMEFRSFRPVFDEMEFLDPEYDLRYFNEVKRVVENVKKELVSTRSAMRFQRESIDRTNTLRGFSYYRSFAPVFTNYYRYIMPPIRNQFYLLRSEKILDDVGEVFKEKQAIFPLVVADDSELKNFVYDLKILSAVVHIYRGSETDLKKAASDLEFLIGENQEKISYVTSDPQKQDVYLFLVGVFDLLYKANRDDFVMASHFLRKKLFYLWNTVSDRNAVNEDLKKVKLQVIYDRYAPIMDPDSRDYQELYKPYRTEVLGGFKDLESEIGATGEEQPADQETPVGEQPNQLPADTPDTPVAPAAAEPAAEPADQAPAQQ